MLYSSRSEAAPSGWFIWLSLTPTLNSVNLFRWSFLQQLGTWQCWRRVPFQDLSSPANSHEIYLAQGKTQHLNQHAICKAALCLCFANRGRWSYCRQMTSYYRRVTAYCRQVTRTRHSKFGGTKLGLRTSYQKDSLLFTHKPQKGLN